MVRVQLHGLHMDWVGREKGSSLRASTGDCGGVKSLAILGRKGRGTMSGLWSESVERGDSEGAGRGQGMNRYGGELLGEEDNPVNVGDDGRELHCDDDEPGGEVD